MTAICLNAKSSVQTEGRSNIFTNFKTDAKSYVFMKQLTNTCISTILHLRNILSEDYFEERNLNGTTVKLLRRRKGENYVTKIERWLEGAFEALEKKYLKKLMLDIQDADSDLTLEIYTITFNYNKGGERVFKPSDTELNTIRLLQMCNAITQTYGRLPPRVKLSMRLSYYESTPDDYQPAGYTDWEPVDLEFPKKARCVEIGFTGTQHHFFKLINKSCLNEKFFKDMDAFKSSNPTLPLEEIQETQRTRTRAKRELCFDKTDGIAKKESIKASDIIRLTNSKNKREIFAVNEKLNSLPVEKSWAKNRVTEVSKPTKSCKGVSDTQNQTVRCACLSSDKSQSMFSCLGCKFLVHAECFGILRYDNTRRIRFYCHLCHQKENFKCHDKVLVGLKSSSDQQKLAILRKILRHCTTVDKITLNKMQKIAGVTCPQNIVIVVQNKMIEIGVAVHQKKRKNFLIDKRVLDKKLLQYFYKVPVSNQKQNQVLPHSIRNLENCKSQDSLHSLPFKGSQQPAASQEHLIINSQISQQTCDIFSL